MTDEAQDLSLRIERLERRSRRKSFALFLLLAGLVASFVLNRSDIASAREGTASRSDVDQHTNRIAALLRVAVMPDPRGAS